MDKELTALETLVELKRFLNELNLGNVDKLFIDGACNIIEKDLNILELFKKSLTLETVPLHFEQKSNPDDSIYMQLEQSFRFAKNQLEAECHKALTEWVIENIDKETVKKWLEE